MVTTADLTRLWKHYDEQAKKPFVGAPRAKFMADRLHILLSLPSGEKTSKYRKLPVDPSEALKFISLMTDDEFFIFTSTGDQNITEIAAEPGGDEPAPECVDEPVKVRVKFDKIDARWVVYVDHQQVMKPIGMYVYKDQAYAVAKAIDRNKPHHLIELWKQL